MLQEQRQEVPIDPSSDTPFRRRRPAGWSTRSSHQKKTHGNGYASGIFKEVKPRAPCSRLSLPAMISVGDITPNIFKLDELREAEHLRTRQLPHTLKETRFTKRWKIQASRLYTISTESTGFRSRTRRRSTSSIWPCSTAHIRPIRGGDEGEGAKWRVTRTYHQDPDPLLLSG